MKNCLEKVFVGVDCHKNTIACYVNGKFQEFKTDFKGYLKALEWAKKQNINTVWALEGAYSHGLSFSKFLLNSGCEVYEFNALATAKARKALSISGEKNDYGDAKVISIFAHHMKLQEVSLSTVELKRKLSARKLLVKQRTELINNLKHDFIKSGYVLPFSCLTTQKAANWLKKHEDFIVSNMGEMISVLNEKIKKIEEEIEKETPLKAKRLCVLTGIGVLTASIIYTETKGKKMNKAQFASYCGVAPVECSSGQSSTYRNNKRGNRTLNSILYSMSLHQMRFNEIGSMYFKKKLSEGKTKRQARKCLARRLSDQIWKILFVD